MNNVEFNIHQKRRAPNKKELDADPSWVILYSSSVATGGRNRFPYADVLEKRRESDKDNIYDKEPHVTDLPNTKGTRVAYACIKADIKSFELLTLCRKLLAVYKDSKHGSLSVHVNGFTEKQKYRLNEAVIAAAYAASVEMPNFKSDRKDHKGIRELTIYGSLKSDAYKRTIAEAEGNALCRYLSMLPPNKLTPTEYVKILQSLCKEHKWKMEFLDIAALKRKKAGAFLAVAQGSSVQDAGIACIRYNPTRISKMKKLALVGKGICYDTGGNNLKPPKYMYGMHEDMHLNVDYPVECWLALAMNHIGPKAYKPNDVVTASDGTTIEVVHTDAEGRMVLSDTLNFASQKKPTLLLDYATLTGACVYSLGTSYTGVFTNREKLIPDLIRVGQESGERVWPFPMDEDYDTALKSQVADIKQCTLEGNADHILAARFLSRFVKHDTPWIHLDLASSTSKGGLAHIPTDTTGFGIRYTLNLLDHDKVWKG
jgi:leucyl aminopeptidase